MSTSRVPWLYRVVRDRSGQSEPVAVVLILLVVVMATATIFITGSAAVEDGRKAVAVSQAEQAFVALDSKTSLAALAESDRQRLELGLDETDGTLSVTDDGEIRIEMFDIETGDHIATVMDEELGTVVYEYDETTIAYQGGGVWRSDGEGAVMISRPEFHYRDSTVTLPLVRVTGDPSLDGVVYVEPGAVPYQRVYPNPASNPLLVNEVPRSNVRITVTSDYYEAWHAYFRDSTNAETGLDHPTKTAWVVLDAKPEFVTLDNGLLATSGNTEIKISGTGNYLDSYDSSVGTYSDPAQSHRGGTLMAAGDITATGNSGLTGNLASGGDVDLSSRSTTIDGDVAFTDWFYWVDRGRQQSQTVPVGPTGPPQVTGEISTDPRIITMDPVDVFVRERVDDIQRKNDNDATALIADDRLHFDGADAGTLTEGDYYLSRLDLDRKTLTLDTTAGDINLAVRERMLLNSGGNDVAKLEVIGDGVVTIYVAGDGAGPHLKIGRKSQVRVPDQQAERLRIYGTSSLVGEIKGDSGQPTIFEGVIFAPAGETGTGIVTVGNADVYGAVITGSFDIQNKASFHYDEGLQHVEFRVAHDGTTISYLHIALHEADFTDV